MRSAIVVLVLFSLASAAPKKNNLGFRNLYKPSLIPGEKPNSRIIGGQEAEPNSFPYQGFLEVYSQSEGWYCGASLISENYVVTAGHCGDGGVQAVITLGAHRPLQNEDTQVVIESSDITVHRDYDEVEITNDIAVIGLPQGVALTDAIQPISLPSRSDANNDFAGTTARVSGWGLTSGNGNTISSVLRYVDVEVMSNPQCERYFGTLLDSIVCTSGSESTGTCSGDSGGPLVVDGALIGVVSFGGLGCPDGVPSAFTRVTSFLDWIESNSDVRTV